LLVRRRICARLLAAIAHSTTPFSVIRCGSFTRRDDDDTARQLFEGSRIVERGG
jgi:hypothetical protein